jgi:hypothetical protein
MTIASRSVRRATERRRFGSEIPRLTVPSGTAGSRRAFAAEKELQAQEDTNMPDTLEARIREKAHMLWEEAGRPEGRAVEHWEKARTLVAIEDDRTGLKPATPPASEPLEIQDNLGEPPGALTDQGDRMQVPSEQIAARAQRAAKPARAAKAAPAEKTKKARSRKR